MATKRAGSNRVARAVTVNARGSSSCSVPLPASVPSPACARTRSTVTLRPSTTAANASARSAWRRSPRTTCRSFCTSPASVPDSRVAMSERCKRDEVDVGEREVELDRSAVDASATLPVARAAADELRIDVGQRERRAVPREARRAAR